MLSGKTNKLNVLQNWKKSGTVNNDIIIQPLSVGARWPHG